MVNLLGKEMIMKQHILPNQAAEVSKEFFYSLFDELVDRKDWSNYHHKKVTIGKMIECLESEQYPTLHIDKQLKCGMQKENRYDVFQQGRGKSHGDTLCDALWEAVKKSR
jgi:hypothetical protein